MGGTTRKDGHARLLDLCLDERETFLSYTDRKSETALKETKKRTETFGSATDQLHCHADGNHHRQKTDLGNAVPVTETDSRILRQFPVAETDSVDWGSSVTDADFRPEFFLLTETDFGFAGLSV